MLNADTKRHIDAARDVLVGKVPNPISQVNEITNALVYKFMDDMDERSASMGGKRRYFTGQYEKYSWRQIMDPKVGAIQRLGLYTEALNRLSENPDLPELFRGIFRNAYLPFNDPRTLSLFLNEINYFDYQNSEQLGNAYEYLLSIMGSQGDAGQFRTPRHIIDFIVKVLDPTKDDSVLDPACGTAGFLISAYTHVMSKHDGKDDTIGVTNSVERPLTADEKRKLHNNYHGFDIDDNMVKMAQVNMYLHGFPDPKIIIHDSLSSEDYWDDRYSVIMANPPFMSPKGGIVPHSKFGVQSNRAEVLFVDYIKSHLKPNGRAGIIVPEGIIFQSGNTYRQLRKRLVEDGLYAVVSLPSGVFNPYAGVKTSILFFDNDRAKQRKEIIFCKISKEGYDLGAQRRPLCNENGDEPEWCPKHSDFPEVLEVLNKWKTGQKIENGLSVYVEKAKIAESGEYNLSGDRYLIGPDFANTKWPMIDLGNEDYFVIESGGTPDSSNPEFWNGEINWATLADLPAQNTITYIDETIRKITDKGLSKSSAKLFPPKTILVSSRATIGRIAVNKKPLATNQGFKNILIKDFSKVNEKYVAYMLTHLVPRMLTIASGGTFKEISKNNFLKLKIPIPLLEIQERIVSELDGYASIIFGARQIVQNWKPKIDIKPEWEKVKLGEVVEILTDYTANGSFASLAKYAKYTKEKNYAVVVRLTDLRKSMISDEMNYLSEDSYNFLKKTSLFGGEYLIANVGANLGDSYIMPSIKIPATLGPNMYLVKFNQQTSVEYIQTITQQFIKPRILELSISAAQPKINKDQFRSIEIPLPQLDIQKQIVETIEAEWALVESSKKLIKIYEQKMKDTIDKLWHD